jgi:uridine kinase
MISDYNFNAEYNFDHPQAFDILEITRCLDSLKRGNETEIPVYDFATHSRSDAVGKVKPCEVIMFEGILVLHVPEILKRLNMKVCVFPTHIPLHVCKSVTPRFDIHGHALHTSMRSYSTSRQ